MLREESERINITGFVGITLLPHQQAVVAALVAAERSGSIVQTCHEYDMLTCDPIEMRTSAVILAEAFGSGKTIELLALCLHQRGYRIDRPLYNKDAPSNWYKNYVKETSPVVMTTLIFVASSAFAQWEHTVRTHTVLSILLIKKSADLLLLDGAASYDIVLVRNGMTAKKSFISLIANKGVKWHRVVYDDYDMIKLPNDTAFISAQFSVFVSATCAVTGRFSRKVAADQLLKTHFSIKCLPSFVQKSIDIPRINSYIHAESSSANCLIKLLRDLNAHDISEMLNGDAVCAAATMLGIKSTSISDIFQRVLDKKYKDYTEAKLIQSAAANIDGPDVTVPDDYPSAITWKKIVNGLKGKGNTPLLLCPKSRRLLAELCMVAKETEEKAGRELRKFVENAKAGECQVCLLPLSESGAFIMKCCGVVVCDKCGIESNRISAIRELRGLCCNCKKEISVADLIFVEQEFHIENIEMPTAASMTVAPATGKVAAVLAIIGGAQGVPFTSHLRLIQGVNQIPNEGRRKFVIFSNYDETLHNIKRELSRAAIPFVTLEGTTEALRNRIAQFRDAVDVLLINSMKHCAGTNLEFATDIIFTHKIQNKTIEEQAAGRGQRFGRTCSLSIHYILYENER